MAAQALILSGNNRRDEFWRWSFAAAIVLAAHFGLIASYLLMPKPGPAGAPLAPAVIIDLAPAPVAPVSEQDIAPGPEMPEVIETQPEPLPEVRPVEALPKIEAPADVVLREPEPKPVEQKPVEKPPEPKTIERRPASRATATPRSEHRPAERPAAPSPGSEATRAAVANWRDQVYARLLGAKRCPRGVIEKGTVSLLFVLDRGGGVVSKTVSRGSGMPALDREALEMVSRAAPFPPVPAGQRTPVRLPIPLNFDCRGG